MSTATTPDIGVTVQIEFPQRATTHNVECIRSGVLALVCQPGNATANDHDFQIKTEVGSLKVLNRLDECPLQMLKPETELLT